MAFNDDEPIVTAATAGKNTKPKGLVTIKKPVYSKEEVELSKPDSVTAVVELNATTSTTVREGLDLVAVLDISGSMAGAKLDDMKKAMQFVLQKLTPMDRLSVVTFSNGATRHCPLRLVTDDAQKAIKGIVDGLQANGGTNIKDGLDTGLAVLNDRRDFKGRAANIFLMSDGQQTANEARDVNPGDFGVFTFGFGKDTDNKLLTDIARKSHGGTFSTVPDGANLTKPFSQLLGGLLTVVAQNVQLTLTPNTDSDSDLDTIVVAPGTDYTYTTDPDTKLITIKFGALFAGESRKVTIDITLKASSNSSGYRAKLAEAQHGYTFLGKDHNNQPQDIDVERVEKPSTYVSSNVLAVQAEIARRRHANAIAVAMAQADNTKLDDARHTLTDAQKALDGTGVGDVQTKKQVDMLKAELQQLLTLMASQADYDAKGRAYALAAEMSHGRQRFGDRGDDTDAVRLFATGRMDTYLDQAKQFEKDPTQPLPTAADDVKNELAANPVSAVSTQLAFYLQQAIEALQAIEKIISPHA